MRAALLLLIAFGCRRDEQPATKPRDAIVAVPVADARQADALVADPCAAAVAEMTAGNQAYDAEIASQGFTLEAWRTLPTGTEIAARGARAAAEAEMARAARARAVFARKRSGDIVTYTLEGTRYRGLYLGPDRPGIHALGRKADQMFVLSPRSVRVASCTDPDAFRGSCDEAATAVVLELPPGTTFGGFVTIERDWFQLDRVGTREVPCPP